MEIAILGIKGVPGHHGVEVVVDSLLPHLAQLGHNITVYGYSTYTIPSDNHQGVRIQTVRGSSRKNFEMISHMLLASLGTRRESFDIIHIHNTDPCLLAWLPKSRYGIIATSHGQAYIRKKWSVPAKVMSKVAERVFVRLPRVITSVSKPLAVFYQDKYKKDVLYIPNGIKFRPKPAAKYLAKWQLKPQNFLFCSAGRIERTKGIHTLIEAYAQLKPEIPLIIAGGGAGSDLKYFSDLKKNPPNGLRFVGFLTGDALYALYAYARIFIFPSEYEAMSIALLEALSFGTPTVYSDIPENEAVAAGLGYSFNVSNSGAMVNQLKHVLDNYPEAVDRGQNAKKIVKERHDWERIAMQYNEIYQSLVTAS